MQARYYDPEIGRFYSNDPIGFRDIHSFNRYAYANNNPYKFNDPTGMASVKIKQDCDYPGNCTTSAPQKKSDDKTHTNKNAFTNYVENSLHGLSSISFEEMWDKLSGLNPAVSGGLAGLKFAAMLPKLGGVKNLIMFGQNPNQVYHAFRHTDKLGLSRDVVMEAIRKDIGNPSRFNLGINNMSTLVNGIKLDYPVWKFPNGSVNVGRITGPKAK